MAAKTCVVITHAHPVWKGPDQLGKNIRNRVRSINPDLIVSLNGNPLWTRPWILSNMFSVYPLKRILPSRKYSLEGAVGIDSLDGEIDRPTLDRILDHEEIYLKGGYHDECMLMTFTDVVGGLRDRRKSARVIFPTDCIIDNPNYETPPEVSLLSHVFTHGTLAKRREDGADYLDAYFTSATNTLERLRIQATREFDFSKGPDVIYNINPK